MSSLAVIQIEEWLAVIILTSFISLITWIFVRSVNSQERNTKAINNLHITMTEISGMIRQMEAERQLFSNGCTDRHGVISDKLGEHEKIIKTHSHRITRIETTLHIQE